MRFGIIFISFLVVFVAINNIYADEAAISLTDGIVITKDSSSKTTTKMTTEENLQNKLKQTEALKEDPDDEEKEGGIFSFLNFSFFKKDKKITEPEKTESNEDFQARVFRMAEKGDTNALMTLGYMHLYGLNGFDINYRKTFEYYSLAAESGNDIAINNLGSLYYSGIGVKKDVEHAAELFSKASNAGNIDATINLAVIFLSEQGVLHNPQSASLLLKDAAEKSSPVAKYLLGYLYMKGIGVPQNMKKAVENIRFAAEQNYDEAQYMLGYLYLNGWGVMQNYNNAIKYFTRAYNQGNVSAMYELGNMYGSETKIEPDFYKSYVAFNMAAYHGVPDAERRRDVVGKEKLKKDEILQAQAESENFKAEPSELTQYVRSTFGNSLALYIDKSAPVYKAAY